MTEKAPKALPQIKRPMQITQTTLIIDIATPMIKITFMIIMSRSLPNLTMKGSQPIAPIIAPPI